MTSPTDLRTTRTNLGGRKAKSLIFALLVVGLVMFLPSVSFGQGSTLERDAYTSSTSPGTNTGSATILRVSGSGSGIVANGYIRHHLTTSLPPGTTGANVAKATIKFYVSKVTSPGTIDVYLVSGAWAENTITHNAQP
ncbi:MAG TPA: DNRLRE domain-containing protein, partial [Pyrinomonadaceae bacterium]|nr:DNRLRE domain-containing protein [Pyrinomonadaceae bacterium]